MNILLTSSGRRTYLVDYLKQALAGSGEVHAANSVYSIAMQLADKSVCTPNIYDDEYINFLLKYCLDNKISAIISLFDIDLPVLARSKNIFAENGVQVVVSDYWVTQVCNDKFKTFKFLTEHGFLAPRSFVDLLEVKEALANGEMNFPLIIKPRWGMGSIGIYEAENDLELDVFFAKVKKDIQRTYLKYESLEDLEHSVLIQEKIVGQEYGMDVLNDLSGNFAAAVPKKKLAMRSGETDSAEVIDHDGLIRLGKDLSDKLRHCGNLDVDCFEKNGFFYVLEMNCRFGGQYPFTHLAGADFPQAIVSWLEGKTPPPKCFEFISGTVGVKDITPKILLPR
jgi:carbamoyl-phosphate synthase large subunit